MKPLIIGNWKMHGSKSANQALMKGLLKCCDVQVADWVVCAPYPYLYQCEEMLQGSSIAWGAQAASAYPSGAHTGQVSVHMIAEFGASYILMGHSERRQALSITSEQVALAAKAVVDAGLTVVVCVGETLDQRQQGQLEAVLSAQINPVLDSIPAEMAEKLVIAYEPVWAIGSGLAATTEDIFKVHDFIKNLLKEKDAKFFNSVKILYGGSVKPANAAEILTIDNVDGALVGGASLDPKAFSEIGKWK